MIRSQTHSNIYKSVCSPNARSTNPRGIGLEIVFIRHIIRGCPFSYLTTTLKTDGCAPIPLGNDLISVTQGSFFYLFLNVYTKLKAIRS